VVTSKIPAPSGHRTPRLSVPDRPVSRIESMQNDVPDGSETPSWTEGGSTSASRRHPESRVLWRVSSSSSGQSAHPRPCEGAIFVAVRHRPAACGRSAVHDSADHPRHIARGGPAGTCELRCHHNWLVRRVISPGQRSNQAPVRSDGNIGGMARDLEVEALTDDQRIRLLEAAAADEREGRLVRCSTPTEVRQLMATFSDPRS
jgi:hypothetical protein